MKLLLSSILLCSPCLAKTLTPVTYQQDGHQITAKAVKYESGYGYNLEADTILKLVTLDWPPYIDEKLCNKGWLYQLTVKLLLQKGYGVHIEFYPWARAVRAAELGKADILFPEYFIDDGVMSDNKLGKTRNNLLALSSAIPGGNLSLIALKGNTPPYDGSLESIKDQLIGVVRSYKNTPELDELINTQQINTIVANNEYQLVHLLLSLRVRLIVADLEVLTASIEKSTASVKDKQQMKSALVALTPALAYKPLYYMVSKSNPQWQRILADLNSEIASIKKHDALMNYIEQQQLQCSEQS